MNMIKGGLDTNGNLWISRKNRGKHQSCPKSQTYCGDWCPHFGEPAKIEAEAPSARRDLSLCLTIWEFDEFEDERGKGV